MIASSESRFLQALEWCQSLWEFKAQLSSLPCQAIELLGEVCQDPLDLYVLLHRYSREVDRALVAIDLYARSVDNWRVKGEHCSLGFGVKDHCTILNCLLNFGKLPFSFTSYTGNFDSETLIFEFLKDWKNIDLAPFYREKIDEFRSPPVQDRVMAISEAETESARHGFDTDKRIQIKD